MNTLDLILIMILYRSYTYYDLILIIYIHSSPVIPFLLYASLSTILATLVE